MTAAVARSSESISPAATLLQHFARSAELTPDAVAIGGVGRAPLTYEALHHHLVETAQALRGIGVEGDARIAAVLPNGPELASLFVATACVGGFAPLNPAYRDQEFSFYLEDLRPKALIVLRGAPTPAREAARRLGVRLVELEPKGPAGMFELLDESGGTLPPSTAPIDGDPQAVALVLHTSGTTARPKIVPLLQANLMASARHIAHTLGLAPGDRCLNVMPLFHIHGLMASTLASLHAGASVFCPPAFDAGAFPAWLESVKPTWYTAVPTIHQAILEQMSRRPDVARSAGLRFIRSSSASLPPKVLHDLEAAFAAPVIEAYGMTEAAHQMTSNPLPPAPHKPGSVGLPAGPQVLVVDPSGQPLAAGERGEVVIRGPNVMSGYAGNPAANESAFTPSGYFRTGDEGCFDEDGYLFLAGRLKEIINRGGEKVSPLELDAILLEHPAVRQAVAFAVPHPTLGEDVAMAAVLKPGASANESELRAFLAARVAAFKVPQQIVLVDDIPRGPSGKLQRLSLAKLLADRLRPAYASSDDPLQQQLALIWAEVLQVDVSRIGVTDSFFSLGGDSLMVDTIISKAAGTGIDPEIIFRYPTIREIVTAHRRKSGSAGTAQSAISAPAVPDGPRVIPSTASPQLPSQAAPPTEVRTSRSGAWVWIVAALAAVAVVWLLVR